MIKKTIHAFVREIPTRDARGRSQSHDAMLNTPGPGRQLQNIATTGNADADRALLNVLAGIEGVQQYVAATAPPVPPAFNSPLDANRELSAEGLGRRWDPGTLWTGLQGISRQIEEFGAAWKATGADALEENPDFDNRTRDAATVRRMAQAGHVLWSSPGSVASAATDRAAAVGAATRVANAATDMRSCIRALNEASKALWRRDKPAA